MPKRKSPSTALKPDTPESFKELVLRYEARRLEIASCATSPDYLLSSERAGFEFGAVAHA